MNSNIKKIAALALAALLTACSSSSSSSESKYTYMPEEQQLIDDLRATGYSEVDKRSDIELVEAGWSVCDTLNQPELTINDAVMTANSLLDDNATTESAAQWADAVVTMSIVRLCPQHDFWLEM